MAKFKTISQQNKEAFDTNSKYYFNTTKYGGIQGDLMLFDLAVCKDLYIEIDQVEISVSLDNSKENEYEYQLAQNRFIRYLIEMGLINFQYEVSGLNYLYDDVFWDIWETALNDKGDEGMAEFYNLDVNQNVFFDKLFQGYGTATTFNNLLKVFSDYYEKVF